MIAAIGGETQMTAKLPIFAVAAGILLGISIGGPAAAQKPGGILKIYFFDSPASMSIHGKRPLRPKGR